MGHAKRMHWAAAILGATVWAGSVATAAATATTAATPSELRIEEFLPQGRASGVEAVQLRFSSSAVAFGDADAQAPVVLACEGPVPEGQGRWLDDTRWTYTFEHTAPAGVRCVAKVDPKFRDTNGQALKESVRYEFDTGAPAVTDFRPYPGVDIDEEQVFILSLNAPVAPEDVARHSHCEVEGVAERIPVKPVSDTHRKALMEAAYFPEPAKGSTVVLLQCARVLPPETTVRLAIGPGIRALGQPDALSVSSQERMLEYEVRPSFTASLSCTRERAGRPCLPIRPLSVKFSAPIPTGALAGMRLSVGDVVFEPDADDEGSGFLSEVTYPGPFPAGASLTLSLPTGVRDDAGRALANADRFPMRIELSDYPPLAKFASGTFGVIERFAYSQPGTANPEPAAVPVTLRHIEPDPTVAGADGEAGQVADLRTVDDAEVLRWYARLQRLESGRWSEKQLQDIAAGRAPRDDYGSEVPRIDARSVSLLKAQPAVSRLTLPGEAPEGQRPLEVVGIPLKEPGFHVLEIESPRLGASLLENGEPMYVRTGVLLTNLALHLKRGQDDLLVWVTTLAGAEPVAEADVNVLDCRGKPLLQGRTNARGIWHHRAAIDAPDYCPETGLSGLFVSARIPADHPQAHGEADYAFVLSGWDRGIETWRFNVPTSDSTEPESLTHTVFDRSLFRVGETVSMKHYLRDAVRDGLSVPTGGRPDRLLIEHQGSSQRYEQPIVWRETPSDGLAALSEFDIPESAHLGSYSVRLTDKDQKWYGSSRFRVEAFRLPLLAGTLGMRGGERPDVLVDPRRLDIDMQLSWVSGGAASGQKVLLNAAVQDRAVYFEDYADYSFTAPPRALTADSEDGAAGPAEETMPQRRLFVSDRAFTLDANGAAAVGIDTVPRVDRPQRFELEANFADPSGEIQTLSRSVDVWPAALQAGLKAEGWDRVDHDIPVRLLALGIDGKPQAGVPMRLLALERKTYTVRTRMVGGFYRYDSQTERRELGTVCQGNTDAAGGLPCTVRFDHAGAYELVAVAQDTQGRASQAYSVVWASGDDELWFGGQDDDRIDLIPARRDWAAGEEAEFQVRMPFREAIALVSVEREGVLWTDLVTLKGTDPVLKIPVSPDWGPNVYVSVLVLRGRLYQVPWQSFLEWGWRRPAAWLDAFGDNPGDTLVTSRIDLAKPAFRFGLAEIRVDGSADRLEVELVPEREVWKVREEAVAKVRVRLPDGKPAAHATVAFAAVDEALLELAPNDSWRLYEAMHPRRSLAVRTATTQMEVVGRRHYGRKAVAAGGGGGTLPTRHLFDTLLSWQPMVRLDENGEAVLRFRMNDALSRFRLVALADYGPGYFGEASASVVTRQDLQVVSGLPPVVREGDRYLASVIVRNSTEQERVLEVKAVREISGRSMSLPTQTLRLPAKGSGSVSWQEVAPALEWPAESAAAGWRFEASDGVVTDRMEVTQRIEPSLPTTTVQASLRGLQAGESMQVPVAAPSAALRDPSGRAFGGIALDVSASLLGGLEGVREWWREYPYTCLEQSASQALALDDPERWKAVVARLATHMDDHGLLRYFPGTAPGSEVLTAYLVSVSAEARAQGKAFALPDEALRRMLDGLQAFAEGRLKRRAPGAGDELDSRRLMAMEALARHGRVSPALLASVDARPEAWPTPTVVDWLSVWLRMPAQPERQHALAQARSILVSRMAVSGVMMAFSDTRLNAAPGLMATHITPLSRLMLAVMDEPEWQDDLPRMAQGLIDAQRGGTWAITTDNLLSVLALRRFAAHFESVRATGVVQAALPAGPVAELALPPAGQAAQTASARVAWPALQDSLRLQHQGQGRAWVSVRAQARVPAAQAQGTAYRIARKVVPVQQHAQGRWSRGDVYRVELELEARDASNWVVLDDPVPAGAVILGSGLGRDAANYQMDAEDDYPPAFVERGASAYRAYFDYLPKGRITVSYTVRLNAVGQFMLPPTRLEALYQPDLQASFPNPDGIRVEAGPYDGAQQ